MKVLFLGTSDFAVPTLESLYHSSHSIIGVYTQPDRLAGRHLKSKMSPVKKKAMELNLPIFQPEKLSSPIEFHQLKTLTPEIIIVVAYGQILKPEILTLPTYGCINLHASLLPRWRGAAPIQKAILEGDKTTGVTTQYMVSQLDAGDVLLQSKTDISPEDTTQTLHNRLEKLGAILILKTLEEISLGNIIRKSQNESEVTYAQKLSKPLGYLNPFLNSAVYLDRQIRALNPWPGTSIFIRKQRLKIKKAKLHLSIQKNPGQIFEHSGLIFLSTREGCLELQRLQWEGKKEMHPKEWLNGMQSLLKGSRENISIPLLEIENSF